MNARIGAWEVLLAAPWRRPREGAERVHRRPPRALWQGLRRHGERGTVVAALLLALWSWELKHPALFSLRPLETALILGLGAAGLGWALHRRQTDRLRRVTSGLVLLGCSAAILLALVQEGWFRWQRWQVLQAPPLMRVLGAHFVVGFRDYAELAPLAERGLIGGIYLTRRNVAGRSLGEVRAEIDKLQALRRQAGLPPLFVAADQEGGDVSHLSPLLPAQPPLARLAGLQTGERGLAAYRYGQQQGGALQALGVNLNLSPVVDLKPEKRGGWVDTHTLIHKRAIATDPAIVEQVAAAYVRGLQTRAVQGTLKHFPGLGQVRADTHHRPARLPLGLDRLQREWRPFRDISQRTGAAIMVGHVTVDAVDAARPASTSRAVIDGLIRRQWQYDGLILTDDLNMGAVRHLGITNAARACLNAGADLVLLTYDPDQYFRVMHELHRAYRRGAVDDLQLAHAKGRIRQHWRMFAGVT